LPSIWEFKRWPKARAGRMPKTRPKNLKQYKKRVKTKTEDSKNVWHWTPRQKKKKEAEIKSK